MKTVDISNWREFQLSELFVIKNTKSITAANLIPDSGTTPYVTAQEGNNGVQTYVSCPDSWLDEGGCILIGGKTLTFSYQATAFCSNDSHNIALYTKSSKAKVLPTQLFLLSVLRVALEPLFSWSDSISKRKTAELSICLPVDASDNPNWGFMEQTMRSVMEQQEDRFDVVRELAKSTRTPVGVDEWGEFRIDELFNVVKGSRLRSTDRTPGDIPYVGASQFNNGITHYIGNDEKIHPGGVLTVCYDGPVGTTFYQPEPFWVTDSVNVLYPHDELSAETLLFIAPIIQRVGLNFNYNDKWKLADMEAAIIKLPIDTSGNPDWAYMESTMKALLEKKASELHVLEQLLPQPEVQEVV